MELFILMRDFGRDGREAIVNPEETRRDIVSVVRECLVRDKPIAFIWRVTAGEPPEDITQEIIDEARADLEAQPINRLELAWDHVRDLRKHEVA